MAASTPAMSARPSPGHRRSSSATNVSISALSASIAPSGATSTAVTSTRATAANKTPASTKAKAVVKRRNSLSAGTIVSKDARVLAGVFAMVDVRVGQDAQIDCSSVVAEKMAELGAVIVKRFTPRVTHIVLSHLTDAWKDKIAKWQSNISVGLARRVDGRPEMQIVSQLWVNACYVSKTRMDEKPFFPVSKANSNGVEGHLHLNGAMKQFVAANPTPAATTASTIFRGTTSAENTPAPPAPKMTHLAFNTTSSSSVNTKSSSTNGSTSRTATANNNSTTGTRPNAAAVAVNRRKTLDAQGVSAIANVRKPAGVSTTNTTTTVAAPTSRSAAIQFQFGAAAALAAATLGSHAVKRKRRALSMEPTASDAIQKLLTASGNELVTPRKEAAAETTTTRVTSAGAKKKLDLDVILTPVSIEKSSKRRLLSSAKRRKTMSEVPSTTLSMPVHHVEATLLPADPNPQKKLFQDTPTSECVAESQSEPEGDEEECKPPATAVESLTNGDVVGELVPASASTDGATSGAVVDGYGEDDASAASNVAAISSDTLGSGSTSTVALAPPKEPVASAASATATAVATEVPSTEAGSANTFSIGVSGRPVRFTRARAGSAAAVSKTAEPSPAAKAPVAAVPGVWKCNVCRGSNTRARRLCKHCRASKTTAQVALPVKEVAPVSTRATTRRPVTSAAPEPKTPSAPARVVKESVITSPKASTGFGISTRRILTTPKTITKSASAASKRQRAPPAGAAAAASKTATAARKLPLAPPRTPAKPISQSASSSSSQPPKTPAARSISVLEMTPVRVTEVAAAGGSKRSLSINSTPNSAASKKAHVGSSSISNHRTSGHDTSFEEKVAVDQLERIVTPQRVSSSTQRSTTSFGNTPVKTPVDKKSLAPPPRRVRSVIGITGVDLETRGVIECAVHAIDASMVAEPGHRKARVVKSVDYSAAVTHLIVGEDTKRTIKVLFAIARGAWIVSEAWVFSSLELEQWQPEEEYELAIHANKFARMNPEARQIFRGMKFFVGSNVEPSREVLQSLLQCSGGEVCNQISVADMCICGDGSLFRRAQRTGVRVVTAKWVFDSIGAMKLEDDDKYGLSTASFEAEE